MFKRRTELDRRLRKLEKELSSVNSNLSSLSKEEARHKPDASLRSGPAVSGSGRAADGRGGEKFADYFSTSFQVSKPLRHERRIQRNKAIVMSVFVLMVLFWIVHRFFL